MRKTVAVLLVITGLAVALYPFARGLYRDYRTGQALEIFEESREGERAAPPAVEEAEAEERPPEEEKEGPYRGPAPVAVLEIAKIDLRLPVLEGATDRNLRYGAALIEELAGIGERGNTVITAHRAHGYGRLFNRLDELEEGDEVVLVTAERRFSYRVFENAIFDAEENSYLRDDPGKRKLTLITCHPLYQVNPPYRLVVQARLDEN